MIPTMSFMRRRIGSHAAILISFVAGLAAYGCGGGSDTNTGPGNNNPPPPPTPAQTAAPVITSVAWVQEAGCVAGTAGPVTITTTATDTDTPVANLSFTGTVTSCTPAISMATATVTCPQTGLYQGSVTVTDPESNSDAQSFSFGPCEEGSAP